MMVLYIICSLEEQLSRKLDYKVAQAIDDEVQGLQFVGRVG